MKRNSSMKLHRLPQLLLLGAAIAASSAACGGKQQVGDGAASGSSRAAEREAQQAIGSGGERTAAAAAEIAQAQTPEEREAARQRVIQAKREDAAVLYLEGAHGSRDYRRLERLMSEILEATPNDPDALFNLGLLKYEQGDTPAAIEYWNQATAANESYARGLAAVGTLRYMDGDVAGAEQIFLQCVERSETEAGCNINLAQIARTRALGDGRLTSAEARDSILRLRWALGGESRNPQAYADLARVYREMGQLDLALLVSVNAVQLGIEEAPVLNQLGLVHLRKDNVVEAYAAFNHAVQIDPNFLDAWMNIGAMALSFRDFEVANDAFGRVVAGADRIPEDQLVDAILSHGVAKRGVDDLAGAEADYKRVLELRPNDTRALFNLGVLYQEGHRDYREAVTWFERFQTAYAQPDSQLGKDVAHRLTTLNALIQILEMDGN